MRSFSVAVAICGGRRSAGRRGHMMSSPIVLAPVEDYYVVYKARDYADTTTFRHKVLLYYILRYLVKYYYI